MQLKPAKINISPPAPHNKKVCQAPARVTHVPICQHFHDKSQFSTIVDQIKQNLVCNFSGPDAEINYAH